MKQIQLTQGEVALVDDSDYEWLNQWKWYATQDRHTFYAIRTTGRRQNRSAQLMHRLILGLRPGDKRQCDHIDKNGLNNQLSNLRVCTLSQNPQYQKKKAGTSRYKGVYWHCSYHKWYSHIRVKGKNVHLGSFNSEIDAARSYDVAALKHHCEFAMTNKMLGLR